MWISKLITHDVVKAEIKPRKSDKWTKAQNIIINCPIRIRHDKISLKIIIRHWETKWLTCFLATWPLNNQNDKIIKNCIFI